MKIGIIGPYGKIGESILREALQQGLDVTSIVKNPTELGSEVSQMKKSIFRLTSKDLQAFDALVIALPFLGDLRLHTKAAEHLVAIARNLDTRLLFVGGSGSLFLNTTHRTKWKDHRTFPEKLKPLATAMNEALTIVKTSKEVHWTYVSAAENFNPSIPMTGHFQIGGTEIPHNDAGQSCISYQDYAKAFVDEVITDAHPNQWISVYQ